MPRGKKEDQPVLEELSEEDIDGVVGGGPTLSKGTTPSAGFQEPLVGFQEPLVGKVNKLKKNEEDYPIEHGI